MFSLYYRYTEHSRKFCLVCVLTQRGGEEELPVPLLLSDHLGQGEAHRAPQPAVSHDELFLERDFSRPSHV